MAKNGAKLDRITLQHHFDSRASQPDSLSRAAPICSPELAKDLGGLVFAPKHRDDLQSGLSIFAVSHPDQESARRASELAGHYDSQMTGATACMSFADSIALKSAQDLKLPSRFLQLQAILRAYHTVLEVVLGIGHCVPLALGTFLKRFDRMQLQLDALLDGKRTPLRPPEDDELADGANKYYQKGYLRLIPGRILCSVSYFLLIIIF